MTRKKLYPLVVTASLAGLGWLTANLFIPSLGSADTHICLFRLVTGIPCPACGSTTSMLSFLHGDLAGVIRWNPMGLLLLAAMILFPLWILYDRLYGKDSFLGFYLGFESILKKKWVMLPAILLVLANWAWSLYKGF